jgi:hypothetical protein
MQKDVERSESELNLPETCYAFRRVPSAQLFSSPVYIAAKTIASNAVGNSF